jgi:hypothetical protein
MDAGEPRLRRRGFFLHSDTTGDSDTGELENPEGFVVRVRIPRSPARSSAPRAVSSTRSSSGRTRTETQQAADEGQPAIRSGSVTGSRQRAH